MAKKMNTQNEMNKPEYTLLNKDQVFGEQAIDLFQNLGAESGATDFAVANGAAEGNTAWFLSTAAGYGDVDIVNQSGSHGVAYASSCGGIRPAFACLDLRALFGDPAEVESHICKDLSGFPEVEFGEYPQTAADRLMARTLEEEYKKGSLRKTGKNYESVRFVAGASASAECPEYEYLQKKYVRVRYASKDTHKLSNGKTCQTGNRVWIEVQPVRWFYDENAGILISRPVLIAGILFSSDSNYDGNFAGTEAARLLSEGFAKDLVPSTLPEMTAEEKAKYDEEMERARQRRNPYGLSFGYVTEEDIIRGAIESDVAVFVHGPSSEGKSARVKQIDPTCEIIYLRNATPDSLNGRSVYNQSTGEMIDIPPTWYKKVVAKCEAEPDKLHVVFFDEINNALPSIQGMAFNIVLDREVNGLWKLPDNARVVAAGNEMQDSLAANQIAAPFFNRFAHVYINTTTEKWLKWARENDIHPAIYSYIAYKRGETLRSKYDGEKPNADPRKWEMASKMLYTTGRPEMLRSLIGEEITDEFVQFCNQPVITLQRVLDGDYTEEEIRDLNTAERYATTMGLSQADDADLAVVREFVRGLGEEFRAVFDSLRTLDMQKASGSR